jgi:hypothetical protein
MIALWIRLILVGSHRGPRAAERFKELFHIEDAAIEQSVPNAPTEAVLFSFNRADVEAPYSYPPNFPEDTNNIDYQLRLGFERATAWLTSCPTEAVEKWRTERGIVHLRIEAGVFSTALSFGVPPALLAQCGRLGLPLEIQARHCELPDLVDDLLAFLPDASPFTLEGFVGFGADEPQQEGGPFTVELLPASGPQAPAGFRMSAGDGWRVTARLDEGPGVGERVRQLPALNPPPVPLESIAECSRLLRCTTSQDPYCEYGDHFVGLLATLMQMYGAVVYCQSTRRWIYAV